MGKESLKSTVNWSPYLDKDGNKIDLAKSIELGRNEIAGYYIKVQRNQGTQNNSTIHTIETESGEMISFWGSGVLDGDDNLGHPRVLDKANDTPKGAFVYIEWKGKQLKKDADPNNPNSYYHNWEVFTDSEKGENGYKPGGAGVMAEPPAASSEVSNEAASTVEETGPAPQASQQPATATEEDDDLPF